MSKLSVRDKAAQALTQNFAGVDENAGLDLFTDKSLKVVRKRDLYGAHVSTI